MQIRKFLNKVILLFFILLYFLIVSPYIIGARFTFIWGDDVYRIATCYYRGILAPLTTYLFWSGRYTHDLLTFVFNNPIMHNYFFVILCAELFFFLLSFFFLYERILRSFQINKYCHHIIVLICFFVFIDLHPNIGMAFFSIDWYLCYTWTVSLVFIFYGFFIELYVLNSSLHRKLKYIIMTVVGIIIIGLVETLSWPFFLSIIGIYSFWTFTNSQDQKKEIKKLLIILTIFFLISTFSPGNFIRSYWVAKSTTLSDRIHASIECFKYGILLFIEKRYWILLFLSIPFSYKRKTSIHGLWVILLFLICFVPMIMFSCFNSASCESRTTLLWHYWITTTYIVVAFYVSNLISNNRQRIISIIFFLVFFVLVPSVKEQDSYIEQYFYSKNLLNHFYDESLSRSKLIKKQLNSNQINIPYIDIPYLYPYQQDIAALPVYYGGKKYLGVKYKINITGNNNHQDNLLHLTQSQYFWWLK